MSVEAELKQSKIRSLNLAPPVSVSVGTSLGQVIDVMKTQRAACVLVCEQDRVRGIFTERDLLTKVINTASDLAAPIDDFMTAAPRTLSLDDPLSDAVMLMHEGGYRHIPLVDGYGRVKGLLDVRHIIEFLAEQFPTEVLNLPPRVHQHLNTPEGA
ncbi:MAG: CBS domain-containing protein [Acidobacteriota bacterium]|nr:CBS domain-containing protein [Blastocatellia bacterium]MDW8238828.1 CBS domain-containing protein [Acidobacteriota bacterium]